METGLFKSEKDSSNGNRTIQMGTGLFKWEQDSSNIWEQDSSNGNRMLQMGQDSSNETGLLK